MLIEYEQHLQQEMVNIKLGEKGKEYQILVLPLVFKKKKIKIVLMGSLSGYG